MLRKALLMTGLILFCTACPNSESVEIGELSEGDSIVRTYELKTSDYRDDINYTANFTSKQDSNKSFRLTYPSRLVMNGSEFWHDKAFIGDRSFYSLDNQVLDQKEVIFEWFTTSGDIVEDVVEIPDFPLVSETPDRNVSAQRNFVISFSQSFQKSDRVEIGFSSSNSWLNIEGARIARNKIVIPKGSLALLLKKSNEDMPDSYESDNISGLLVYTIMRSADQKSSDGTMLKLNFQHEYRKIRLNIEK